MKSEKTELIANYIGSDYTYAYSQRFRDTLFKNNCVDQHLLIGLSEKVEENTVELTDRQMVRADTEQATEIER